MERTSENGHPCYIQHSPTCAPTSRNLSVVQPWRLLGDEEHAEGRNRYADDGNKPEHPCPGGILHQNCANNETECCRRVELRLTRRRGGSASLIPIPPQPPNAPMARACSVGSGKTSTRSVRAEGIVIAAADDHAKREYSVDDETAPARPTDAAKCSEYYQRDLAPDKPGTNGKHTKACYPADECNLYNRKHVNGMILVSTRKDTDDMD